MKAYSDIGDFDQATSIFNIISSHHIPDLKAYHTIMHTYSKIQSPKILDYYNDFIKYHVPNTATYNILYSWIISTQDYKTAHDWYSRIFKSISPDSYTNSIGVISGHVQPSPLSLTNVYTASIYISKMIKEKKHHEAYKHLPHILSVIQNGGNVFYTCVLRLLLDMKKGDEGVLVFDAFWSNVVEFDWAGYTIAFSVLASVGDLKRSRALFLRFLKFTGSSLDIAPLDSPDYSPDYFRESLEYAPDFYSHKNPTLSQSLPHLPRGIVGTESSPSVFMDISIQFEFWAVFPLFPTLFPQTDFLVHERIRASCLNSTLEVALVLMENFSVPYHLRKFVFSECVKGDRFDLVTRWVGDALRRGHDDDLLVFADFLDEAVLPFKQLVDLLGDVFSNAKKFPDSVALRILNRCGDSNDFGLLKVLWRRLFDNSVSVSSDSCSRFDLLALKYGF